MRVEQVMTRPVITVGENLPLEEAARIMVDRGIGSLVVTRGQDIVGIITETDMFKVFVEMLGGGHPSTRVTVRVVEQKGSLADLASRIAAAGGNIHSLATFAGDDPQHRFIAARVEDIDPEAIASEQIELISVWRAD
jgi:acetoin utilization protein AcuB